jgi:methionyl-tRNA formyltransferase
MSRGTCVLLTCEREDIGDATIAFVQQHFDLRWMARYADDVICYTPDELTELVASERIDYLFGFLSPAIVPKKVLDRVGTAINFHPAPPRWPGIGGSCYALYHGDDTFGVTAHIMEPRVDTGLILRVDTFPILPDDSQLSLCERLLYRCLNQFYDVLTELILRGKVEPSGHQWERKPLTWTQLSQWLTLSDTDTAEEVARKIRSSEHPSYPDATVVIHGHRFVYQRE